MMGSPTALGGEMLTTATSLSGRVCGAPKALADPTLVKPVFLLFSSSAGEERSCELASRRL
jgi:hypothetical protein